MSYITEKEYYLVWNGLGLTLSEREMFQKNCRVDEFNSITQRVFESYFSKSEWLERVKIAISFESMA